MSRLRSTWCDMFRSKKSNDSMDHSILPQKLESFMELDLRHWPGFFTPYWSKTENSSWRRAL